MRKLMLLFVVLSLTFAVSVFAADKDDIQALIDEYVHLESNLAAQAKLMTDDRIMISAGRRQTDNATNMKVQIANEAVLEKLDPGAELTVTAEDPIIRVYGETAIASFYRYWDVVPSAEAVKESGEFPSGPPPDIVTLVLVKQAGAWKIVHTHMSALHPRN